MFIECFPVIIFFFLQFVAILFHLYDCCDMAMHPFAFKFLSRIDIYPLIWSVLL